MQTALLFIYFFHQEGFYSLKYKKYGHFIDFLFIDQIQTNTHTFTLINSHSFTLNKNFNSVLGKKCIAIQTHKKKKNVHELQIIRCWALYFHFFYFMNFYNEKSVFKTALWVDIPLHSVH